MKKVLFLFSFLLVFVVSCGDGGKNEGDSENYFDGQNHDADSENTEISDYDSNPDNSGKTDDPVDPDNGDDGGENNPVENPDDDKPSENTEKYCILGCKKAADCITGTPTAISDADNYKCDDGRCVYLGCLSDAECDEVYGAVTQATGRVYRCNKNGAYGYPECTPTCSTAEDCDLYGQGSTQYAYDLDNYKCESGLCVFTGCNSDTECENTMSSSDYKCLPQEYVGKTVKICTLSCKSAADCANSAYPADFYECRNSQCVTKNCESDEWCQNYMGADYSCR